MSVILFNRKNLPKIFAITVFLFSFFTHVVYASVDQIVFINQPQTITIGQSSTQYQIQLQNASGGLEQAAETIYFTLPLDLGTFSSQKDGTAFTASSSVYIATGNGNKYFYFKPNNLGTFVLSVTAHNKSDTLNWQTEQAVQVIDPATTSTNNDDIDTSSSTSTSTSEDNTVATTTATTTQTNTVIEYISSHSSPEDLSNYEVSPPIQISAGRDRIGYIGNPLEFASQYKLSFGVINTGCIFHWSFGDGLDALGEKISHTYKYVGQYAVVLNADCNENHAVSRTGVKILTPEISLAFASTSDAVEIDNKGGTEINIGGWSLKDASSTFVFPKDTIIGAEKSIVVSCEDTHVCAATSSSVFLNDPIGKQICVLTKTDMLENDMLQMGTRTENIQTITVGEAEILAAKYKNSLAVKNTEPSSKTATSSSDIQYVASAVAEIESSSTKNIWNTILTFPRHALTEIFHSFYNF